MDLDSLRCFLTVADTLQFRVAAERLALSPAALSDRVRRLEEELDAPLFTRTTRRVHLTDAGRRLVPHARQLLDAAARTAGVVHGIAHLPRFELTIGTRYELGVSWLCPLLGPLAEARPERTLHLYMGDSGALLDRLERGAVDACVLSARLTRPHIRYALLHEEAYAFVGAPRACSTTGPHPPHSAAGDPSPEPGDPRVDDSFLIAGSSEPGIRTRLSGALVGPCNAEEAGAFTLVDATPDLPLFRYLLDALPEGPPWRFRSNLYVGGIAAIRVMVLAGAGVAVLPRYFVADDLRAGRLVEVFTDPEPKRDWFRLLWRADHPREEELVRLAEALRASPLR